MILPPEATAGALVGAATADGLATTAADGLGPAGAALAAGLGLAAAAGAEVGAAAAGAVVAAAGAGGAGGELQAASKPLAAPPANTRSSRRRLKP
jgi:hypothetical protein